MTDEHQSGPPEARPPDDLSYTEKYAGTPYGRPLVEPAAPTPVPEPRARHRFGCFGIVLILLGLYWLVPGVLTFISTLNLWYSGKLFDQPVPASMERAMGTALVLSMLISLAWIAIGLKILARPGRFSVGCTGVFAFLGAVTAAIWVAGIKDPPTVVLIGLGVYLAFSVLFALVAFTAAQALD